MAIPNYDGDVDDDDDIQMMNLPVPASQSSTEDIMVEFASTPPDTITPGRPFTRT